MKSRAFEEGSDYGFTWPKHRDTPTVDCPYSKGTDEYWEWQDGYVHGKRCEIMT